VTSSNQSGLENRKKYTPVSCIAAEPQAKLVRKTANSLEKVHVRNAGIGRSAQVAVYGCSLGI